MSKQLSVKPSLVSGEAVPKVRKKRYRLKTMKTDQELAGRCLTGEPFEEHNAKLFERHGVLNSAKKRYGKFFIKMVSAKDFRFESSGLLLREMRLSRNATWKLLNGSLASFCFPEYQQPDKFLLPEESLRRL